MPENKAYPPVICDLTSHVDVCDIHTPMPQKIAPLMMCDHNVHTPIHNSCSPVISQTNADVMCGLTTNETNRTSVILTTCTCRFCLLCSSPLCMRRCPSLENSGQLLIQVPFQKSSGAYLLQSLFTPRRRKPRRHTLEKSSLNPLKPFSLPLSLPEAL